METKKIKYREEKRAYLEEMLDNLDYGNAYTLGNILDVFCENINNERYSYDCLREMFNSQIERLIKENLSLEEIYDNYPDISSKDYFFNADGKILFIDDIIDLRDEDEDVYNLLVEDILENPESYRDCVYYDGIIVNETLDVVNAFNFIDEIKDDTLSFVSLDENNETKSKKLYIFLDSIIDYSRLSSQLGIDNKELTEKAFNEIFDYTKKLVEKDNVILGNLASRYDTRDVDLITKCCLVDRKILPKLPDFGVFETSLGDVIDLDKFLEDAKEHLEKIDVKEIL